MSFPSHLLFGFPLEEYYSAFKFFEDFLEEQVSQGTSFKRLSYWNIKMTFASYATLDFES
jgi:hypothetical protein